MFINARKIISYYKYFFYLLIANIKTYKGVYTLCTPVKKK